MKKAPRRSAKPRRMQRPARRAVGKKVLLLPKCLLFFILTTLIAFAEPPAQDQPTVIVIVGAPGEEEFGIAFSQWAGLWEKAAAKAGAKLVNIGLKSVEATADREQLQQTLAAEPKEGGELWLVLIGHGTFDGKEAKFNLRGPDFSATELAAWLQSIHRPIAVIDTASSS